MNILDFNNQLNSIYNSVGDYYENYLFMINNFKTLYTINIIILLLLIFLIIFVYIKFKTINLNKIDSIGEYKKQEEKHSNFILFSVIPLIILLFLAIIIIYF